MLQSETQILISSIFVQIKIYKIMNKIANMIKREKDSNIANKLPPNFAEQVLNLELQIQSNSTIDIQIINRLIQLYSIAVEYYESIKSNKYVIFKNKIVNLLLKPTVNHVMETTTRQNNMFEVEQIPLSNQNFMKKKQLEQNIIFALHNSEGEVKNIIRNANDRYDSINKMINTGLFMQEFHLRERIKSRKGKTNQVLSRQSTECDPKQSQIQNIKDIGQEKLQQIQFDSELIQQIAHQISGQSKTQLSNESSIKQIKKCQQFCSLQNNQFLIHKMGKESQVQQSIKQVNKKCKDQKKVLTLKSKKKRQNIPAQYIIPF